MLTATLFDQQRQRALVEDLLGDPEVMRVLYRATLEQWVVPMLANVIRERQSRAIVRRGFEDYRRAAGYTVWASRD